MTDKEREALERCRDFHGRAAVDFGSIPAARVADLFTLAMAFVAAHTWTKDVPTEDGWYWWRDEEKKSVFKREIAVVDDVPFAFWHGVPHAAADLGGEWCPMTKPE